MALNVARHTQSPQKNPAEKKRKKEKKKKRKRKRKKEKEKKKKKKRKKKKEKPEKSLRKAAARMWWGQLPAHIQRMVGEDRDANYAMYHAEVNGARRRADRAKEIAARSSVSPLGWVTFARTFFPIVYDTEPKAIVKSLVRAIWRAHAAGHAQAENDKKDKNDKNDKNGKAGKKDPWSASKEDVHDLGRAHDEYGRYTRRVRFDGDVYESDRRKDYYVEPEHVVVRLLAFNSPEVLGLDKDRAYHRAFGARA